MRKWPSPNRHYDQGWYNGYLVGVVVGAVLTVAVATIIAWMYS